MNSPHIICNYFSTKGHASNILTGLLLLQEQGYDISINNCIGSSDAPSPLSPGVELFIDGIKCYIDLDDGYQHNGKYIIDRIDNYQFYFKRSFSHELNTKYGLDKYNIYPLGLNFSVYHPNALSYIKNNNAPLKEKVSDSIKYLRYLMSFKTKPREQDFYLDSFIHSYDESIDDIKICFMARLWGVPLDDSRIELMRILKERYKDKIICGMSDNSFSREKCPDLILPNSLTYKSNYLKAMQACQICIATTGLHDSIGWKFAEYVAASRCVVTEPLFYEVPGNFKEGQNYITFDSIDNCLNIIDDLLQSPHNILAIQKNNYNYFSKEGAPDKQVLYIIDTVTKAINNLI